MTTPEIWRVMAFALALPLAACGSSDTARYLIDAPTAAVGQTRVSVASVELRDVSLPSHASGSEILVMDEGGALRPLGDAQWADDPERAVTGTLAELLDTRSTATVAAEPWPLLDGPSARVDLRIDRMLAKAPNLYEISGQAAVSAADGRPRERVERVSVTVPLTEITAPAVREAQGRAIAALADELIGLLR